ncbi:MAG: hypothetical protein ABSC05_26935 [Candidatus Solibacter sp.]
MRAVIAVASLLVTALSLAVDVIHPSPGSSLCRYGGCRFDQIFAGIDAAGASRDAVATLVDADPANPLVWCTYAQVLSVRGETQQAQFAFDHAVSLGPGMSPVLMRVANFDFTHGRREHGFLLSARILSQTSAFDEIVFSYLQRADVPAGTLLGTAIPATSRPARSWMTWLRAHGSDQDLQDTWTWMQRNALLDEKSAAEVAWELWNRKSYQTAHTLWTSWLGATQLLANTRFDTAPRETPFDWALGSSPAVAVTRGNGLDVRFSGTENVAFSGVRQFTVLPPGRYRLSAEVSSENLTTDQGPFFRIFDPANPDRLHAESAPILGTVGKSWITVEFTVASGTGALVIQLERRPSERFDNRIGGTLHIQQVSLIPFSTPPE